MSTEIPNLWPEDLSKDTDTSPLAILKAQASMLGERTKGLAEGRVNKFRYDSEEDNSGDLHYTFGIIAPAIGNYRVDIFELHTALTRLYPIKIVVHAHEQSEVIEAKDQKALLEALQKVFSSNRVRDIVRAIRAHSIGMGAKEVDPDVPF